MNRQVALMFPGQGAYLPGVFVHLHRLEEVAETLEIVDAVAHAEGTAPVSTLLTLTDSPDAETLVRQEPARLHMALYAGAIAAYRMLDTRFDIHPHVLVGHSIGEVAAMAAAGAISVDDGARVMAARDAALRQRPPAPGGMVALELSVSMTEHLLGAVGTSRTEVAADNGPRQCVVSGPEDELSRVAAAAEHLGARATWLRVAYPFHNSMLGGALDKYSEILADIEFRRPQVALFSPVTGKFLKHPTELHESLVDHLMQRVRFREALHILHGRGIDQFVECGPRSILTDLVRANLVSVSAHAPLRARHDQDAIKAMLNGHATTPPSRPAPDVVAVPEPVVTTNGSGTAALPDRPAVLTTLRTLYAEELEYPERVLGDDVNLEADLGVDSIKQIELFNRALRRFNLPTPPQKLRVTSYPTLGRVADLLVSIAEDRQEATR